jgi:hypothetical protein
MRARGSVRSLWFVLGVASLATAACSGKDPYNPGTPLGTFHVTGKLVQSTCGAVPDPWEFDVKLAHEAPTFYWIQGGAPISGRVEQSRVALRAEDVHNVRPADAKGRVAACDVLRQDELDVALAGETDAALVDLDDTRRLAGKLVYRFTPTAGSDCVDQTTALGGGFAALPCEVTYDVVATRTVAPR